jgi:glycosyltransferase involved in cell wall biosynthesis
VAKRIAILHYAGPPVIGGVELTIAHHARALSALGYQVRVISGAGQSFDDRIEIYVDPMFSSSDPQILTVKRELDQGAVSESFYELVARQEASLREALHDCDVCIVHNVHTLNKNLALSAALHRIESPRMIAWCHDLAWTNAQYQPELYDAYPWNLLREVWSNTRYVTVSEARRAEMEGMFRGVSANIDVVPAGVDIPAFFQWTPGMWMIENALHILDADLLLLLPARITRRKNIELALRVLHDLKARDDQDYRLIITGPPGPHNPANPGYLGELLELRANLKLEGAVHFLYELAKPAYIPDDATVANLYQIADALFFPSLQEGFGIPILEAGLVNIPIFCSDLPPFRQTAQDNVVFFDPAADSPAAIARVIYSSFTRDVRYRLKKRVRQDFRWEAIVRAQLVPLI